MTFCTVVVEPAGAAERRRFSASSRNYRALEAIPHGGSFTISVVGDHLCALDRAR